MALYLLKAKPSLPLVLKRKADEVVDLSNSDSDATDDDDEESAGPVVRRPSAQFVAAKQQVSLIVLLTICHVVQ